MEVSKDESLFASLRLCGNMIHRHQNFADDHYFPQGRKGAETQRKRSLGSDSSFVG